MLDLGSGGTDSCQTPIKCFKLDITSCLRSERLWSIKTISLSDDSFQLIVHTYVGARMNRLIEYTVA